MLWRCWGGDLVADPDPRERDIPASSLADLRGRIAAEDPALFEALQAPAVRTAVDQELVTLDVALQPGSEVAFLPPMSGG